MSVPPRTRPVLPLEYHMGFLEMLHAHPEVFRVITYSELEWDKDHDYRSGYPRERLAWRAAQHDSGDDRISVLLQHDVDADPEAAMRLIEYELELGIPTNVMVFAKCLDRGILKNERRVQAVDYELDIALLQEAERRGFEVGYHTNCVEQALWHPVIAVNRFREDLRSLRQEFQINVFSPHGGVPGPSGENNAFVELPEDLTREVRWVHNRFGVTFDGNYSDGGLVGGKHDPTDRDLRDFVRKWLPGRRYRVLTHPQYYGSPAMTHPVLERAAWSREIYAGYADEVRDFWDGVLPKAVVGS